METVFSLKIKELEEKIAGLEKQLADKQCELDDEKLTISAMEKNMECLYVENWTTTDSNGKKGEFSGNILWRKGTGMCWYKNGTYIEGEWDSTGEITEGELRHTYSDEVITKWEYGEEIDQEEDEE
jgi:hypothetical protein